MKWPTVLGSWTSSLLPPVVDFTYEKIETGKTLFSLQFIENLARIWIPCDFQELREDEALLTDTRHVFFSVLVFDSVWFPLLHSISGKGFYAFTSHVLNTLRQHICCSHFLCNVCTWKPHSGMKQCVFSLRTEYILWPPGRTFLLLMQTPCSDWHHGPRQQDPAACCLPSRTFGNVGFPFLLELSPHL